MNESVMTRTLSPRQVFQKATAAFSETAIAVITSPYYLLYDRNTKSPILAIAGALKEEDISHHLRGWLAIKDKEAQYVQVAVSCSTTALIRQVLICFRVPSFLPLLSAVYHGPTFLAGIGVALPVGMQA